MPKRTINFRDQLIKDLENPREAAHYLSAAAEDSEEMLLVALRDVAEARQMAHVAEQAGVAREALYRMLSRSGNPTYNSFRSVLAALGIRICFTPIGTADSGLSRIEATSPNAIGAFRPHAIQDAAKKKEPGTEQATSARSIYGASNLIASLMPQEQFVRSA